MNLGSILDGLTRSPSVVRPVKFGIGHVNAQGQKTRAMAEAVLVHVDEEERSSIAPETDAYLAKKFPGKVILDRQRNAEETVRFFALALRDKSDPAKPFADGGVEQLRPALVYAVLEYLDDEYRKFIAAEYTAQPTDEDEQKMREQAVEKSSPVPR